MRCEIQLTLETFDREGEPLCKGQPELSGFRHLCYHCSHASRSRREVFCELFGIPIRIFEKYGLKEWKSLRREILDRDALQCSICGRSENLHIHHLDQDRTNDLPDNLITLCEACHARVHIAMRYLGIDVVRDRLLFIAGRGGEGPCAYNGSRNTSAVEQN